MKHRIAQAVILVCLSLFLSCNEGPYQLFYTVVNDNLLNNNDLDDTLSVTGMTEIAGSYYITAGNIRSRAQSSTSWGAASIATAVHNYIAGDGTNLYVSVIDEATGGGGSRLYYCPGASTATATAIAIADQRSIFKVKSTGSAVFAVYNLISNSASYSLCRLNLGAFDIIIASGLTAPIADFSARDAANVYYVSGPNVYLSGALVTPTGNTALFSGVFYDPAADRVYAATTTGLLYRSTDNACSSWEAAYGPYTYTKNNNPVAVSFTEFASTPTAATHILVGSRGSGFWEIDTSTGFAVTRFADSSVADLYNGAIETFYIDPSDKDGLVRVFFCTMGAGLWSNTYNAGWGPTWTRE